MAAIGQRQPPTSPPSPIPPSAPPPPPCITHHAAAMCQIRRQEEASDSAWRLPIRQLGSHRHGRGVCVKLANLSSKNTYHNQIDRPHRRCVNDNIVAGTGDQDKNGYAGGLQDHLLSSNTISPLLVWVSHAAVAGEWSTDLYLKYKFVPADGISNYCRTGKNIFFDFSSVIY